MKEKELFQRFRSAIVHAARLIFTDFRTQYQEERFYSFAIYADNYAGGMNPATQTEEAWQRALATNTMYGKDELGILRYCPDEWDMDYCGVPHHKKEWLDAIRLIEPILDDENLSWEQAVRPTFESMIEALAELDADGFFGRGSEREEITLMIWITDSSLAEEWWAHSIKRLNSDAVYRRFIASGIPECYTAQVR